MVVVLLLWQGVVADGGWARPSSEGHHDRRSQDTHLSSQIPQPLRGQPEQLEADEDTMQVGSERFRLVHPRR